MFNRYSDSGTISQYIGDGNAVYPISGLPELDEESILTIFDVPEKQREDWLVQYRDIPEGISFEDTDATEKIIEQGNLSIVYSGKTLKPLQTRRGLVFIESRYLSPVSDVLDVLELYERVTPFGAPYIVAKAGFLLQAVITVSYTHLSGSLISLLIKGAVAFSPLSWTLDTRSIS